MKLSPRAQQASSGFQPNPGAQGLWRIGAIAAAACLLALPATEALAVSLGKITVQSTLGQPLRAEIDLPGLTPDEASTLAANVASQAAFKAAGVEYNASLSTLRFKLVTRDGRSVLQLTGERVVNDPFIDLIIEANWASGRIVRDYTVLLDPPPELQRSGMPAAAATPASQPSAPPPADAAAYSPPPPVYVPPPVATTGGRSGPARRPGSDDAPSFGSRPLLSPSKLDEARRATAELAAAASAQARIGVVRGTPTPVSLPSSTLPRSPASNAAPAPRRPEGVPPGASNSRLEIKPGDTANKIATANKAATVSLDQMLAALLRKNPDAFIGGNVNRLRSGAILDLPAQSEAEAISPQEASRTIVAQSRNFNEFRRRLAEGVPGATVESASREVRGKVRAHVEEPPKSQASAPDKLTLSKGSVAASAGAKPSSEDKIASSRQAQDASSRMAELSRNLEDLNRLKAGAGEAPSGSASGPKPALAAAAIPPGIAASGNAVPSSAPAPASSAAPTPAVAGAAASTAAQASAATAVKRKPVPAPLVGTEETGFLDELLGNSSALLVGGALLAVLAALGLMQLRRSRQDKAAGFGDSRLPGDSLSGQDARGKDLVSSLGYSPSQLDAAGDVDPVEEADVYLAYGRDQQAEEILKEALQRTPTRVAIHAKLLEIYARRRDAKAFDQVAAEAFNVTKGEGPEWARIKTLGNDLSPFNSLYQTERAAAGGGVPSSFGRDSVRNSSFRDSNLPHMPPTMPGPPPAAGVASGFSQVGSLDLNLDFSGQGPAPSAADARTIDPRAMRTVAASSPTAADRREPTLGATAPQPGRPTAPAVSPPAATPRESNGLPPLSLDIPGSAAAKPAVKPAATPVAADGRPDFGMIEFDLDSLSLAPVEPNATRATAASGSAAPNDPLEVKLELAVEFLAIGDREGARALIEEVLPQASGPVKARAQHMLAELRR